MIRVRLYGQNRGATTCRLCGAAIVWALTDNDRRLPVDVAPVPDAGWILWWDPDEEPEPVQRVSWWRHRAELAGTRERWSTHWSTCPQRDVAHHLREQRDVERPERGHQLDLFAGGRR